MTGRQVQRCRGRPRRPTGSCGSGCRALPGVTAAGGVTALPLSQMMAWGPITSRAARPPEGEKFINADSASSAATTSARWTSRCSRGRVFSQDLDTRTSPRVVVIDERMARAVLAGRGSARQAHPHRRLRRDAGYAVDDGRRRRRRRQAGRARRRLAHCDAIDFTGADAVARDEHRGAPAATIPRRSPHRSRGRSGRSIPTCRSTSADDGGARRRHRWRSGGSRCCC